MGKYDPLYHFLRRKRDGELRMSFRDLERVLGAMLPNGACRAEWWAKADGAPDVQQVAWSQAGYDAFLIGKEEVLFQRRVEPGS
jgi:hypothetical protein